MRPLVTGGTGFIGSALVRRLVREGIIPRVLVRDETALRGINGLSVDLVKGNVRDEESIVSALGGCDTLFHLAADYRLFVPDPETMYATNVGGTRSVLRAAARCGVKRIIHTSSVGTLGIPRDGTPGTEETPVSLREMVGHYKRSKFLAERVALEAAAEGLPVVVVNPSTPVGPHDSRPTPTGKMIADFLAGKMPAYIDTGLNVVDVDDCAEGHLLAAERGAVGRRYILGGENLALREIFTILSEFSGVPAPRIRLPYLPVLMAAALIHPLSLITRRETAIPLTGVRMASKTMFFSSRRAEQELGYRHRPARQALERAVRWFLGS